MLNSRQKQAIETKEKIITKSMELYTIHGYEAVKITDICNACDISIGCFYHHFSSKEDTVYNAYIIFDAHLEKQVTSKSFTTNEEAILFIIEQQLSYTQKRGVPIAQTIVMLQLSTLKKEILKEDRFIYQNIRTHLQLGVDMGEFSIDGKIDVLVNWILRTSRGLIYDWCLHDGNYDLVGTGLHDINLILSNIRIST